MTRTRAASGAAPALAAAGRAAWLQLVPLGLPRVAERAPPTFPGADGREHASIGNVDSDRSSRHARQLLRTGSSCDTWVDADRVARGREDMSIVSRAAGARVGPRASFTRALRRGMVLESSDLR